MPKNERVCAVAGDVQSVTVLAGSLASTLKRLRRHVRGCASCDLAEGCVLLQGFNAQVQAAIQSVVDEFAIQVSADGC